MTQRLAGHFSVDQSAKRIRHYRYAEERMMRTMGGWIALTPELSVKVLLGRQVWDCAQHADLWGRRLPELRARAQVSEPPNPGWVRLMDLLESPEGFGQTPERLVGIYRVLKPHVLAVYQHHLAHANRVYEPPTRRILQRAIEDERRHIASGSAILAQHLRNAETRGRAEAWEERLLALLTDAGGMTGDGLPDPAALDIPADAAGVAGDLVELEMPVGRWPAPPGLEAAVEAHGDKLERRDLEALGLDLATECRGEGLAVYRSLLDRGVAGHEVVALATLGAYRQVKMRLTTGAGTVILLCRWGERDGRWQVLEVKVLGPEGSGPPSPSTHP